MAGFDSFINTAVPIFIAIFFIFILGKALKVPLLGLWNFISGIIGRFRGRDDGEENVSVMQYE